jgi:phosphoenolpyruvate carboxykinase (GTP)
VKRCHGSIPGHETQIGWTPHFQDFNTEGLNGFDEEQFDKCMAFKPEEWKNEILSQGELFLKLYDYLPKEIVFQRELLASRLA